MIWSKDFWKGLGERAVKTFGQTFGAVVLLQVGAAAVGTTAGIEAVNWLGAVSVAALATILSVCTSIVNADFTAGQPTPRRAEIETGNTAD